MLSRSTQIFSPLSEAIFVLETIAKTIRSESSSVYPKVEVDMDRRDEGRDWVFIIHPDLR